MTSIKGKMEFAHPEHTYGDGTKETLTIPVFPHCKFAMISYGSVFCTHDSRMWNSCYVAHMTTKTCPKAFPKRPDGFCQLSDCPITRRDYAKTSRSS